MQPLVEEYSATAVVEANPEIETRVRRADVAATRPRRQVPVQLGLLSLTVLATAICGYHPYSEDGGIYVSGIKYALNPYLYTHDSAFVTSYMHLSIFSHCTAELIRLTHLRVDVALFAIQLGTTWLLLYSCWRLAQRCFFTRAARWAAVALVAVSLSVPVAGSSLFLMDPYVTSRSFSMPLTLLAIVAALDSRWFLAVAYLALTGMFHPLMLIYAAGFLLFLWLIGRRRWLATGAVFAAAVACGAILQWSQRNVIESSAYVAAVITRSYFFLSRWHWYEWIGLAAPLAILWAIARWQRFRFRQPMVALCAACIAEGFTSIVVSLLFSRPDSHSHLVARIQTLRSFQIVYFVLFLLLGGLLGQYWLKSVRWRWITMLATISAGLLAVQLATYPASRHLELPWIKSQNKWVQAFRWVRKNTPENAVFAMDAHYITMPGEDGHVFRAMADRSSLAGYDKEGGAAAVFPDLAGTWMAEQTAETNLNIISDRERIDRLAPFGVTWLILPRSARTSFPCPYKNSAVMVCRMV